MSFFVSFLVTCDEIEGRETVFSNFTSHIIQERCSRQGQHCCRSQRSAASHYFGWKVKIQEIFEKFLTTLHRSSTIHANQVTENQVSEPWSEKPFKEVKLSLTWKMAKFMQKFKDISANWCGNELQYIPHDPLQYIPHDPSLRKKNSHNRGHITDEFSILQKSKTRSTGHEKLLPKGEAHISGIFGSYMYHWTSNKVKFHDFFAFS